MRRIYIWQDDGTLDPDPTWFTPAEYAQLQVLPTCSEALWQDYLAARERLSAARRAVINALQPAVPLTPTEAAALDAARRDFEEP